MSPDVTETLLPLHPEAFRILLVLRDGPAHGYALVKELERDAGHPGRVLPANLYRRMRTLMAQGVIAETDERPDAVAVGERVARAEAHRLRDLVAGASDLLEV